MLDVDIGSDGVADDLSAWWWIVGHAEPAIVCEASLDASTLFSIGEGPVQRTTRFLRKSLAAHAKAAAASPGIVVLTPVAGNAQWETYIWAANGLAGELAKEAMLRQ